MRKRGVTFKLFIMTVVFFLCFYGMVILCQLLLFDQFYENQKISGNEKQLAKFAQNYAQTGWSSSKTSNEAARFMLQNKIQLAILTLDGKVRMDDPYHITLKTDDQSLYVVPLSLFLNSYETEFRAAGIQSGNVVTVEGEMEPGTEAMNQVLYPLSIHKTGRPSVGYTSNVTIGGEYKKVSGVVTELIQPVSRTYTTRQGILLDAISEWFPLSDERKEKLENMEVVEEKWTQTWSGVRNSIMIYPVEQQSGEVDLLFSVTSLQEIGETNEALRWFYVYLGVGGFILIIILSFFFSKMVTRPLISMNNAAKRMVQLDFSVHEPIRQNDELGSLSSSLHTLSRSLDTALGDLKKANQQLVKDIAEKQRMEQAQQEFFANASHELKTPLSIVKSFSEGLQDGVGAGKQDHYLKVIVEEAQNMEMLVEDMLNLATLQSDTFKLRKSTFMLSELLEDVTGNYVHMLQDKQLEATVMTSNELPLHADARWMKHVLSNFIGNAIQHAQENSDITIQIEGRGSRLMFSIENVGDTIPEEKLEQIWQRFYRVESSRNRRTGGTGLGLSIVKRILELHESEYQVENTEKGVKFTVIFKG
ncbi:two-component sensor histidine kinase [Paenibacillus sp. BIHB 4019]|uniref:histidine kinase n=1 Tax=Paenibacillus sp. BIHB 4019 TaxID=1870819 RepID=A0A1B2DQS9_9BACL|nr:HAMP domain-containing sensor histidine kinase [Paenibacillus sp. BIHB 4019]ANY70061.1 two-component sensor histidine kinase [Paenibacillus sp. BIHB 4019]